MICPPVVILWLRVLLRDLGPLLGQLLLQQVQRLPQQGALGPAEEAVHLVVILGVIIVVIRTRQALLCCRLSIAKQRIEIAA